MKLFASDSSRWEAVQTRNALADGHFVYAVKTTKIYCRPICKARLARRSNVWFYRSGPEASNAGFRACKRCKPETEGLMPEERAVTQIRKLVMEKAANDDGGGPSPSPSLGQMARKTGLSKWHFHRVFKRTVGVTPFEYLKNKNKRATWGLEGLPDGVEVDWRAIVGDDLGSIAPADGDFDLAFLTATLDADGSTGSSAGEKKSVSTGMTGASPLSFEDLLVWPESEGEA